MVPSKLHLHGKVGSKDFMNVIELLYGIIVKFIHAVEIFKPAKEFLLASSYLFLIIHFTQIL